MEYDTLLALLLALAQVWLPMLDIWSCFSTIKRPEVVYCLFFLHSNRLLISVLLLILVMFLQMSPVKHFKLTCFQKCAPTVCFFRTGPGYGPTSMWSQSDLLVKKTKHFELQTEWICRSMLVLYSLDTLFKNQMRCMNSSFLCSPNFTSITDC